MKVVIQRVKNANVKINGEVKAEIGLGMLCFIGFKYDDTLYDIEYILKKITGLRIFDDPAGKMNISITNVSGNILIVPNFTLYASCLRGNRPDFANAADADAGKKLFETLQNESQKYSGINFKFGVFRAAMEIELINDRPITIIIDSSDKFSN